MSDTANFLHFFHIYAQCVLVPAICRFLLIEVSAAPGYPNTIETCLTPNFLLFGRQILLSSNTTSTVARI